MSETEITLAKFYLQASGQDAVAALIRSVRDLARLRRLMAGPATIDGLAGTAWERTVQRSAVPGRALAG